jgi:hypothetical protein
VHCNEEVVHLFGQNVASLVFAEIASRRKRVVWHKDPQAKLFGHFGGLTGTSGLVYDTGMNAIELGELAIDVAAERSGLRRYKTQKNIGKIKNWLEHFIGLAPFKMSVGSSSDGKLKPDFLLSDDFSPSLLTIGGEKSEQNGVEYPHPSKKYSEPEVFFGWTLEAYYRAAFGEETSKNLLKFSKAYFGSAIERLPVPLHRFAWAPLPWPEYLEAVKSRAQTGKEFQKTFASAGGRPIAQFFSELMAKLSDGRGNLSFNSGTEIDENHLIHNHCTIVNFKEVRKPVNPADSVSWTVSDQPIAIQAWFTKQKMDTSITTYLDSADDASCPLLRSISWGNPAIHEYGEVWQFVTESKRPLTVSEVMVGMKLGQTPVLDIAVEYLPRLPDQSWFNYAGVASGIVSERRMLTAPFDSFTSSLNEQVLSGIELAEVI